MRRNLLLLGVLIAGGCVSYEEQPVEWDDVSATVAQRNPGTLTFGEALVYARTHNPELKRLRAEAEAAGLDGPPTYINLLANTAESKALGFVDPIALLKLGPRGARARAAHERELAMMAELRARDLEVAAGIAEAYLIERVLLETATPAVDADPDMFARAGLASSADRARVAYAREKERAERATVTAMRQENAARLGVLLGVGPQAQMQMVVPEDREFPPLPRAADVMARPDLAVALARYAVADAEFRVAVYDQYPTFALGPVYNWELLRWGLFLPVRIPVGAAGPARAASLRRDAARLQVEQTLVAAQQDARASRARFDWTSAQDAAARTGAEAAAFDLKSALVHLEVTPDAFGHLAKAAPDAVDRMANARKASLVAARARVALARAYAWPHSEVAR